MTRVAWWRGGSVALLDARARSRAPRRLAGVAVAWALLAGSGSLGQPMPVPVAHDWLPPSVQHGDTTPPEQVKPTKAAVHDGTKTPYKPTAVSWPKPGTGSARLQAPAKGQAQGTKIEAAGTPVWVQPLAVAGAYQGPSAVSVKVLSHQQATALGVSGVLFDVDGGVGAGGGVRVGLDYSGFAQAYGGDYATRLRLVRLPACALTTPQVAACRAQSPLNTTLDASSHSVSAVVSVGAPEAARAQSLSAGTQVGSATTSADSVIGATDSTGQEGGQAGSYAATALKPSGTWAQSGSTGSFTYSYPIALPAASSSLAPSVSLSYDSGSVDGQTATTQAQSSWVGDGWSTADSYIEMTTIPCTDSPEGSASPVAANDACYAGKILTMSLNGSSTPLVYVSSSTAGGVTTSTWKAADDGGEVVTHVAASSSDVFGSYLLGADYWTVTERNGTKYEFGLQHLPGWASGDASTNSVDTEPVYSAHSGDPCYSATGFTSSVCTMAYKWHLDYVLDLRTQAMAYYYAQDTNYYGEDLGAHDVSYIRDSHLVRIDYGFLDGGAYGTVPDQVLFSTSSRCVVSSTVPTCDPISSSNAATEYPDVPYDLVCDSGSTCSAYGPSFFSTVRLTGISTQQYSTAAAAYAAVDSYALTQSEPASGDAFSPTLWLASVQRTGSDTSAGGSAGPITLPPVTFSGVDLQNRVDTSTYPGLYRYRINEITNEMGGTTGVSYGLPTACTAGYVKTATPSSNTESCYPVYWTPQNDTTPILDWFEKYAVTQVLVTDTTGGSLTQEDDYTYSGGAAWHYDDNEVVKAQYRTYGQFRGYDTVTTKTGQLANNPQTKSVTKYYRGMDGDWLSSTSTRSVTLPDSQGGTHTDSNRLAGKALETTAYLGDGGPIDHSTVTSYWISSATATRTRSGLPDLTAATTAVAETWNRQALTDGGATTWRITETDNSYDATTTDPNFALLRHSYTHTVPANAAYNACASTTYAPANAGLNLVGLPASSETDSVACSGFTEGTVSSAPSGYNTLGAPASITYPNQVKSATETFYDDPSFNTTFPQATAPTVGNATMTRKASTATGAGVFTWQTQARTTYDTYGRALDSYDGNGNETVNSYTLDSVGLTTAISVAAPNTVYGATTVTHTSSSTLDPVRGLTLTATDQNGVATTEQYDALGRLTSVWTNSRPTTLTANTTYAYTVSNTGISGVVAQKLNEEGDYVPAVTVYDALGRVRQTQTLSPQSGRLVSETFYDSRGWAYKKNTSHWDPTTGPTLSLPSFADSIELNQDDYVFDGLGRTVQDKSERDGVVKQTTTTVYNGDAVTVIPPAGGVTKTTLTDPLGRTSALREYTTAPTLTTPANTFTGIWYITGGAYTSASYGYDGHGQQNTVTDNAGNVWTTTYNLLGQATSKSDPVAGTSTLAYDADGNVTQSQDSRGDYLSYSYDALNRKTGEYASASSAQTAGPTGNQISAWVYDNANNGVHGMTDPKGQVTYAASYSGGYTYSDQQMGFNVFGESTGEYIAIPAGAQGGTLGTGYLFQHTYLSINGSPLKDIYPAAGGLPSETVTHTSTTALDLPSILGGLGGYGASTSYTYDGKVLQEVIGSGSNEASITDTYDDHTGQLTDQTVTRSTATPSTVDDTTYNHDSSGQITTQTETRLGSSSDSETQCYTYDALDRLTSAWSATDNCATAPTSTAHAQVANTLGTNSAYWTSWTYQTSGLNQGNRAVQTQHAIGTATQDTTTSYTYNANSANQPSTLTSTSTAGGATGSTSYAYDTAGNMTTRTTAATGTQTLTWDNADRLAGSTSTKGATTGCVYDADGSLLIQKDPTTTTLYLPGEQITLTNGTTTETGARYYPLPGGGTAVRTGSGSSYGFEIGDQHGTNTLYLDSTAQTPTWRQFDPYGNPRGTAVTWIDNRTFLSQPTDTNTGLTDIGARYYDPATGRFISLDPVLETTDPLALNGYAYTDSNPVNQEDSTGTVRVTDPGTPPDNGGINTAGGYTCPFGTNSDGSCVVPPGGGRSGSSGGTPSTTISLVSLATGVKAGSCAPISGTVRECARPLPGDATNDNSGGSLALEFFTGTGDPNQIFGPNDPLTQQLMQDGNVQATREMIQQLLVSGQDAVGLCGAHNYSDKPNLNSFYEDMLGVFSGGHFGRNPADGFLGSYSLEYTVSPEVNGKASVNFTVTNTTNAASLTHTTQWPSIISKPINDTADVLSGPSRAIWGKRLPTATETQTFQWSETVSDPCADGTVHCA